MEYQEHWRSIVDTAMLKNSVPRRESERGGQSSVLSTFEINDYFIRYFIKASFLSGSVAEWLACWTQAQTGPGSNRSRDAVG